MMSKELRLDGIMYLKMKDGETADEAKDRLLALLDSVGLALSEHELSIVAE